MYTYLKQPWVQVPNLPIIGCVTRDEFLNLSVSFAKIQSSKNNCFIMRMGGFDEIVHVSVWYRNDNEHGAW